MRGALLPGLLLAGLLLGLASCASAHVEDICINPPGPKPTDGVYNFYTLASRLGCDYRQAGAPCLAAIVAQSASTFTETSNCRGAVHFNAIYFSAAALGFTQEVSYFLAAFSQSIDFVQFKGVDSCGRTMAKKYWTPPLRGFLRTAVQYGGTNRHLGVPFVGFARNPPPLYQALDGITFPLYQSDKTYNGGSKDGCNAEFFDKDFKAYLGQCPALAPDMSDTFYEGALAQARKWAVNETTLLCNAGFTAIDPKTGSPFTGSQCARGTQHSINTNEIQQGPIPLTGTLELGEQVIHFGCTPNCTAENYTVVESSKIYASRFGGYLWNQAKRHGYATMADGRPVPELVARMGIFLHWIADRSSHWYCTDAPASGVVAVKRDKVGAHYDLFMHLDPSACNYVTHGAVHYWEQGVSKLAPGTYSALVGMFRALQEFREKFLRKNPAWFRKDAEPMSFEEVVGTYEKPGILFNMTMIKEADQRVKEEIRALRQHRLPFMPGFWDLCPLKG